MGDEAIDSGWLFDNDVVREGTDDEGSERRAIGC